MNKYKTKKRINLTIDKEIWKIFNILSEEKSINKSKFFQNCCKIFIEKNKNYDINKKS